MNSTQSQPEEHRPHEPGFQKVLWKVAGSLLPLLFLYVILGQINLPVLECYRADLKRCSERHYTLTGELLREKHLDLDRIASVQVLTKKHVAGGGVAASGTVSVVNQVGIFSTVQTALPVLKGPLYQSFFGSASDNRDLIQAFLDDPTQTYISLIGWQELIWGILAALLMLASLVALWFDWSLPERGQRDGSKK